jgi:hypothetical protein
MKRNGIPTGLGDRMGNYLMYAMLGEINNVDIYTTWIYDEKSYGERGTQYPENIEKYITFPKRLKLISQKSYDELDLPYLHYRWVYHCFDYMPETMYRSLTEDKNINCTFDEMINIYRKVCSEVKYNFNLPKEIIERSGFIHLRRGDKGNNTDHNEKILKIVNKFNKISSWIITSDSTIPNQLLENIPNVIFPQWSSDEKIKTLEQFFAYTNASIIIQSVNFQKDHDASWCGWGGYSYVAFQIGLAKQIINLPILISCNVDQEQTRYTYAKKYIDKNLINIFMYNELENIVI